jgi:hypothetical protein
MMKLNHINKYLLGTTLLLIMAVGILFALYRQIATNKNVLTRRGESGTREGEVMRMDLTKVGKLPTIEQRLAGTEKELRYLSEFLVKVLSDTEQMPSLQALESQFTEGLKLVVRIRALKDAQSAARKEGKA